MNTVKKDVKDFWRLLYFVRPHLLVLIIAFACMICFSVLNSLSTTALIPIVDNIISGKKIVINPYIKVPQFILDIISKINSMSQTDLINIILFGGLIYFFLRNLFDFLQTYYMSDLSQRVIRGMKDTIYKKLLSLSMSFYAKNPTPKLMSRITYDTAVIRDSISTGLLDMVLRPLELITHFTVVVGIVLYWGIPIKFLITSILLFPCILLPAVVIAKRLRLITTKAQEKMGDINSILFEIITGIRIVKAFSMQDYECKKFREQNYGFYKLEMKSIKRLNVISPINEFTSVIYIVIVLYLANKEIMAGKLSWGSLAVFVGSVLLMLKPLKRISKVYAIVQQALSSAIRVFDILDTEPEIKELRGARNLEAFDKKMQFKNVCFAYEKKEILKNIGVDIQKGDIVAIVGPSGAGKTTLVNLIPRFYDPTSGSIIIDGIDLKELSLKSLRDKIGIVTQEMILFNDTVFSNISYGAKGHTKEDVIRSARIANAHEFIMKMPDQYDTIIGERGFRMSGGERQRLSIARAIFKNPPILIFDEATSQLDTESERLVQEAIDRLMNGRTVFVIAHRLSTITHANKILVLNNGAIEEYGSHQELMSKSGLYKKLYDMQFFKERQGERG